MKFILLATLSLALALPIETSPVNQDLTVEPVAEELEPLVWIAKDGSLRINPTSSEKLADANIERAVNNHNIARRHPEGLQTTNHLCFGGRHHRPRPHHCEPCHDAPPCVPPSPPPCASPPPPPCAPVDPCDPCDPCDSGDCAWGCDEPCIDELKASCYTKWFCPSTYCNCGEGICPEEPDCNNPCYSRHPVVDGLRRSCVTKWLCPSTYCPSNWCCGPDCWGPDCYECYGPDGCGQWPEGPDCWTPPPIEPDFEPCWEEPTLPPPC